MMTQFCQRKLWLSKKEMLVSIFGAKSNTGIHLDATATAGSDFAGDTKLPPLASGFIATQETSPISAALPCRIHRQRFWADRCGFGQNVGKRQSPLQGRVMRARP